MTPGFKEWAVVTKALGAGQFALILRKGGIHEGKGGFSVEHNRFWLFPTGFHQHADKVRELMVEADGGAEPEVRVPLEVVAEAVDIYKVCDLSQLEALAPYHPWRPEVAAERFAFGKWQGVFAIVVRAWRLDAPQWVAQEPSFGGCKSWVELPVAFPAADGLIPAMEESRFENIRSAVRSRLVG